VCVYIYLYKIKENKRKMVKSDVLELE